MSMANILKEPEGSKITVMDIIQYNQFKHGNESKDNVLFIIYKDAHDVKKVQAIRNPPMEIYFVDEKYRGEFNTPREYIELEKTYSKKVDARRVVSTIYDEMKFATDPITSTLRNIHDTAVATKNWTARKEVFKWPYALMSDLSVEDYYRIMLGYHYDTSNHGHVINKAYLDIESDIYGLTTSEQNMNLDPTNACTLIFTFDENGPQKRDPIVFTLLLRNHKRYPQQEDFENRMSEFIQTCHDEYDKQEVIKDGKVMYIDTKAEYHIKLYDKESELLTTIFELINTIKPDTCSVWNIAYDIPKIAARMEKNGINYIDAMSDKAFPKDARLVELNVDKRAGIEMADRKTFIRMTSTTKWIDDMQAYAAIRKGRKSYGSNKLDNIAKIELGRGKREFRDGVDVTNAAIKDYWNFVLYNIRDVWAQTLIDIVTKDCMSMVYDSNQQSCSIENLTKQTRYQRQIYFTEYLRKGFVGGNNINVDYIRGETEEYAEYLQEIKERKRQRESLDSDNETPDEEDSYDEPDEDDIDTEEQEVAEDVTNAVMSIYRDSVNKKIILPGGLVGNPDYNIPNGTELIRGVYSKHVFDDVMDMDYTAEYPWAKYTRSLSRSTQIGRLIIGEKISPRQNTLPMGQKKRASDIKMYIPGAEFVSDYISGDILSFGNVWFGLPTTEELSNELEAMCC